MSNLDITSIHARPRADRTLYALYGKRALDLILALLLLPLIAPLILALWALTRSDGHAGLYAHRRVGRDGKPFLCWKLCTMVPNADKLLAHHLATNPAHAREWTRTQKLTNDPRVTPLGRFLRRTSLDELPQIWNVIRGDMSFVGPRPVTEGELDRYGLHRHIYLSMKPGVTGLWQIFGRSDGCYDERLRLDRRYADAIGLLADLALILRTALVVVRPTGR